MKTIVTTLDRTLSNKALRVLKGIQKGNKESEKHIYQQLEMNK